MAVARKANEAYGDIIDDVRAMDESGMSLRQIAIRLNELGHTTRRERPWSFKCNELPRVGYLGGIL